ncbi:MAG: hypothetical protein ABI426_04900 [Flavobacterium sp.]
MEIQNTFEFVTKIRRSFLDTAKRDLIINADFIKFEDKNHHDDLYTIFHKSDIKEYRYGIRWIRGAEFTIGREYQIFIRNHEDKVLKINFKSFYGFNKNVNHKKYNDILNALWKHFFGSIVTTYINQFHNGEIFSIGNVEFTEDGITINDKAVFNKKQDKIVWKDLGTRDYHRYFALFSKENAANINHCYYYKDEWNIGVLYSVVIGILKHKDF